MSARRFAAILIAISCLSILISCSSQTEVVKIGTPAYYWQSARDVYATGDYMKALQHLDNLLAKDSELTARALPSELVLKAGIADGYIYAAENYAQGVKNNHSDPSVFRRKMSEYRGDASQLALQFAEDFAKLDKVSGDTVNLELGFPRGTAAPVSQFTKVATGIALSPADTETAQKQSLERGVVLETCRAVGAEDDTAKAAQAFTNGSAKVPRPVFMMAMANTLFRFAQIYASDKMDEPAKMEALMQRAQNALATVPESKETKDLKSKMEATLKKNKK